MTALCDISEHFNPEDVETKLRAQGHPISMATIYRNLPVLLEAGIISRGCYDEDRQPGGLRYEHVWGEEHHDHLVCQHCGKVVEFDYPAIGVLQESVARDHGFELQRRQQVLVGICDDCRTNAPLGEPRRLQ